MALNKNVAKGIKTRQENELLENNKLIAEFMGRIKTFDIVDNDTYRGEVTLSKGLIEEQIEPEISHFEDRYSVTSIAIEENLQYHTSWDWLMPVIKKAYNTEEVYDMGLEFHEIACQMFEDGIEEVYKTVVHTIKLINEDRAKEE